VIWKSRFCFARLTKRWEHRSWVNGSRHRVRRAKQTSMIAKSSTPNTSLQPTAFSGG